MCRWSSGSCLSLWLNAHSLTANKFLHYKLHAQWVDAFCQKNLAPVFCAQSHPGSSLSPGTCCNFVWTTHTQFLLLLLKGCRPKWPLGFHLPTLPYILLRVINYAGKLLALRGKIAATIWRQPQFLPSLFHICSPAKASWIHCNAFKVSTLHL